MTARAEYTADEWVLLISAPQAAIGAVAFSDGAGLLEVLREAVSAAFAQTRGKERFPGNELIAALLDNTTRVDPSRLPQPQQVGEAPDSVRARLGEVATEQCRSAMELLAERSNPKEAAGYAAWVMETAKAAALAARSGGLFSRAPLVDTQEREVLEAIAEALGVEVGELPASDGPTAAGGPGLATGTTPPAPDSVPANANIPSGPISPE